MLSKSLDENIKQLESLFEGCGDFVKRMIPIGENRDIKIYVAYIDMLVSRNILDGHVLSQLMLFMWQTPPKPEAIKRDTLNTIRDSGVTTADLRETDNMGEMASAILSGDTVLMAGDSDRALIIATREMPNRGVGSAETEVAVQGPKDAFTEIMRFNTMLVRRRIKDTHLKVKQLVAGKRSQTSIAVMYLDELVRPQVLEECLNRIGAIDIDAVLDVGYVEQLTADNWMSVFPQAEITERPDKASAAILEGRVAILVDNSPFAMIVPATLSTFFQASDDYYQNWQIMSFTRFIRYAAGLMAVCLPGLYLACALYHPSMIPTLLAYKMAAARQAVPFPALAEIMLMDLAFELLREAGIRLPGPIGNSLGIVGGLIIGQSAVEAGLVSPIVLIIVALTAISGFAIPHVSLVNGLRLSKYVIIAGSWLLGLLGFWIGALVLLIRLVSLKTYGFPYLFPFVAGEVNDYSDIKDTLFRAPLFKMKKRPIFAKSVGDRVHAEPHEKE
ncbi:MAG: spore germination protein [Clostridiales bacterium]|nr:spore germination protein [Clostridiales bacterium]